MAQVKSKDTKPEILFRKTLHFLGLRFCIHVKELPGHPDIVLPKYKSVIFVHGCFWHRHKNCKAASTPQDNQSYWIKKFENTVIRDANNFVKLKELGWNYYIVWECEIKNKAAALHKGRKIKQLLESTI